MVSIKAVKVVFSRAAIDFNDLCRLSGIWRMSIFFVGMVYFLLIIKISDAIKMSSVIYLFRIGNTVSQ
jgi:hypothetical protein